MIPYTGIGNQKAPRAALDLCEQVGRELAERGLTLRTTDRGGCDEAFWHGGWDDHLNPELVRAGVAPRRGVADEPPAPAWALDLAARALGPEAWLRCRDTTRHVHGRTLAALLGPRGDSPSKFLLCHSERQDPRQQSGTGCLAKAADLAGIPVLNIKRLELCDVLAFAHEHAGAPVLRPGDVLPPRLVPLGSLVRTQGGDHYLHLAIGRTDWHVINMGSVRGVAGVLWTKPGLPGHPFEAVSLVALGLTQVTATTENLQRLAREHEERTARA